MKYHPLPLDNPGFGVYVHWPFCASKCPYCDFNSHVRHGGVDQARFAAGFIREMKHMASLAPDRTVTSIFFGGGTPSLMLPSTLEAILRAISDFWPVADDAEITMEANPSSVEAGRFRDYRSAGVNRVSLGVQSLDDTQLRFLGRLHNAREAIEAIDLANQVFDRVSFDLIYARPGQGTEEWQQELKQALAMSPGHLSLYQLTIESGTPFYQLHKSGKLVPPPTEHAAQLYEVTQEMTAAAGLPAYEVSNHACEGQESRHNLTYWRYGEYAGIGPGAHGRLEIDGNRRALVSEKHPENWLAQVETTGHGIVVDDPLNSADQGDEMLLMGLRVKEGIDVGRYEELCGTPLNSERLSHLVELGLLQWISNKRLRATQAGWLVLNSVIAELLFRASGEDFDKAHTEKSFKPTFSRQPGTEVADVPGRVD